MEDRRSVIISAIIGILVLALIIGVIVYLIRFITNRPGGAPTPRPSATINVSGQPDQTDDDTEPEPGVTNPPTTGTKKFTSPRGFEITYPANWGILTCNNSNNIEFDPTTSTDQPGVSCDRALKPVTVLVGVSSCQGGESVNKGGVIFTRQKTQIADGVSYKWCTQTNPTLEITHRVSQSGSRATSKQDFSATVEDMISRIRFGNSI
jgi:hypothetical protein